MKLRFRLINTPLIQTKGYNSAVLLLKGARMLDSGSAFGDETLTIRFVTLENPENFGRKYPAAHPGEITVFLSFFDSGDKRVGFRPLRVKLTYVYIYSHMR